MPDLFDAAERQRFAERLRALPAEALPRWGSMRPPQMLAHLIDTFQVTFKENPATLQKGFLSTPPGRWLALHLPIPRGKIRAPAIFLETPAGEFDSDRARVLAYLDRFALGSQQDWGISPLFGVLTGRQWAILHRTHLHHHLRQFGV